MTEFIDGLKLKFGLDMVATDWREGISKMGLKKDSDNNLKKKKPAKEESGTTSYGKVKNEKKESAKENGAKSDDKKVPKEKKAKKEKKSVEKKAKKELPKSDPIEHQEEVASEGPLTEDPFFITSDGTNYLSTSAPAAKTDENDANDSEEESFSGRLNRRARRSGMNLNTNSNSNSNTKTKNSSNLNVFSKPEIDPDAHPSWAAKRKLKEIPQFQGKKVKFDEAEDDVKPKEELHPSWAAKQKMKPTITEFKGTKVTFDD